MAWLSVSTNGGDAVASGEDQADAVSSRSSPTGQVPIAHCNGRRFWLRFDMNCQHYPPSIRIKGGQIRVRPRKDVNFPDRSEDFQLNTEHPKPSAIMQLHRRPVAHTVRLVALGVGHISVTSGTAPKPKCFETFPPCARARAADAEAELQQ